MSVFVAVPGPLLPYARYQGASILDTRQPRAHCSSATPIGTALGWDICASKLQPRSETAMEPIFCRVGRIHDRQMHVGVLYGARTSLIESGVSTQARRNERWVQTRLLFSESEDMS
ncbi:uncharacterized protein SETTUDRAFT_155129 [Exserohilum turcica Et28A]|uniref:Uncharacterized protein n=1 Tax=Exserohilum turcicum (strain 28A) TaxID=671987 RepID=R0IFD0_EXST2|nr:uncharacterized protein SETTUDRAFT_155129 [Exserohilum turcica Et28A]EOA83771.1 hypothetical protein SETTUDRAFT_155129 [Exserohilum turcica Et28A]